MTKTCSTCKIEKDSSEFGKLKRLIDGLRAECRECRKKNYYENHDIMLEQKLTSYYKHREKRLEESKEKYQNDKDFRTTKIEYARKYNDENKDIISERGKDYRARNKETIALSKKEYNLKKKLEREKWAKNNIVTVEYPKDKYKICTTCQSFKEINGNFSLKTGKTIKCIKYREFCKECESKMNSKYRVENIDKINKRYKNYTQTNKYKTRIKKYKSQEQVKIANRIRKRLRTALRTQNIKDSAEPAIKYLGCSILELIEHFKQNIPPGYTYDDLLSGKLHIDHKTSLMSVDLTNEENLKMVCHYTNLIPLYGPDNCYKGAKFDKKLSIFNKTPDF